MVVIENTSLSEILSMYRELCNEIEYFETILKETETEWKINRKLMFINPSPQSGGYIPVSMDIVAQNLDKIMDRHDKIERLLNAKKRLKKQAERIMNQFDGIDYKVAYARFVEGKKLELIAEELNYSVDGIKKISARISRLIKEKEPFE